MKANVSVCFFINTLYNLVCFLLSLRSNIEISVLICAVALFKM